MKRIQEIVLLLLLLIIWGCSKDQFERPLEDFRLPNDVTIKYEVKTSCPQLYDLSVIYNDGFTCYDFETFSYINTDKTKSVTMLDSAYWIYEFKAKRGAILYIGASVSSKNGISAVRPAIVNTKIYINDKLVKENSNTLYSNCEYIYGIKEQKNEFYLYTKE